MLPTSQLRSRRLTRALRSGVALSAALATATISVRAAEPSPDPIEIAVSVPPQADWVERIGGSRVRVVSIIPGDASPETFAPRPRQLAAIEDATIYVLVGHPDFVFESRHIAPLLSRSSDQRSIRMYPADPKEGASDAKHGEGELDPHIWLSPAAVRETAKSLVAMLTDIDPANAAEYATRGARFEEELAALERDIKRELSALEQRAFLVFHPAWGWFARDFDLQQISIEREGKEPGPRRIIPLIERARALGISTVFVQPGFPSRTGEWIADELAADIVVLDPLARDWFGNMRLAAREIRRAGQP